MKKNIIMIIFLLQMSAYPWSYSSHYGMTGSAAKFVFNSDDSKIVSQFKVHVQYDAETDFFQTAFMGIGLLGTGGVLESFVGMILDKAWLADKFKIDTYMIYPDTAKDKKHLNTLYKIMAHAGTAPDDFDGPTGLIGDGEMLIGHIYAPNGIGFADFMTQYFYNEAVEAWKKNQKYHAAVYLCYASHYLEDAGIPVHAEADYRNLDVLQWQLGYHSYTESYVADNWSKYSATSDSAAAVPMPVCDISSMVRSLAMETYPDVAGWTKAWGYKGGGDYKKGDEPVNVKMFDELVKQEIWRCVPRVSGMFLKFKTEVMKGGTF